MSNQGTSNNIVYLDYSNTAIDSGNVFDTSRPDAEANLMKNTMIVFQEISEVKSEEETSDKKPHDKHS